jgi:succinate dehydrogenase / fumarate reductase cytochrome b subunit
MGNQRFTLQRVTGYIAFLFLIVHLAKFRFAHWFGGVPFLDPDIADKFEITRRGLMEWIMPPGVTLTMYVIGLAAACFHFANGIWTFCISWGITVGAKAQQRVSMGVAVLGLILFSWGAASLYAFSQADKEFLEGWDDRDKTAAVVEHGDASVGDEPAESGH